MTPSGVTVTILDTPPTRSVRGATGQGFITCFAERGPIGSATESNSLDEWVSQHGDRVSYGYGYDAAECFFREGGRTLYTSRVGGSAKAKATGNIFDQSGSSAPGDVALVATAVDEGDWYNAVNVLTLDTDDDGDIPSGYFRLTITHDTEGTLYESTDLLDRAAAIAHFAGGDLYVTLAEGASAEDPRGGQTISLASGTDDHGSAVEADWTAALTAFTPDLGPGQVGAPGRTTDAAYQALVAHARANRRVAYMDGTDTATVATLAADAVAARSVSNDARFGAMFAPWLVVPGVVVGTTRTVPPSASMMGISARVDGDVGHSNQAPAADYGVLNFVSDLSQDPWSEDDRGELEDAGVNVIRNYRGAIRNYSNRTVADKTNDSLWSQLSGSREVMSVAYRAGEVLESFAQKQVDGRGHLLGRLNGEVAAVCMVDFDLGALYGETAAEAFVVDTEGPNNLEDLQAGIVRAALALRVSPGADRLELQLVRRPITEAI